MRANRLRTELYQLNLINICVMLSRCKIAFNYKEFLELILFNIFLKPSLLH